MIYLALLRGINVGGKGTVEMKRLKVVFERQGFTQVRTYINSGNVIFCSTITDTNRLAQQIETALKHEFGFSIPVLLRNMVQIADLVRGIPSSWVNDVVMKCDVMFLKPEVDSPDILTQIPHNPSVEDVRYLPGVVIWRIDRIHVRAGQVIKLASSSLHQHMTVRNPNTVRKLYELMQATEDH